MMVQWWADWRLFRALPYGGNGDLLDQPAFVVDVLRKCEEVNAEIEARIRKENERRAREVEDRARRRR